MHYILYILLKSWKSITLVFEVLDMFLCFYNQNFWRKKGRGFNPNSRNSGIPEFGVSIPGIQWLVITCCCHVQDVKVIMGRNRFWICTELWPPSWHPTWKGNPRLRPTGDVLCLFMLQVKTHFFVIWGNKRGNYG